MTEFDPELSASSTAPSRRALLRAVGGLTLAGGLAGCTDAASDATGTPVSGPVGTDTAVPSPSPTPTPAMTAPPTETPTPAGTQTTTAMRADSETAREFVADLRADEFEGAHARFSDALAQELPRPSLERYWLGLTAQHGVVESIESVETDTREGSETLVVPLDCEQGSQRVEVAVDGKGQLSGLWFPGEYRSPAYVDESAFSERTLTLKPEGCSLPATLSVPASDSGTGTATGTTTGTDAQSVPGVVLVHGSGAHDRDETSGPNKPFRDLAQGLASRGVAVLRYDKRTYACEVAPGEWAIDEIIVDDVVYALDTLREQAEVDPDRTVVAGHSVGATCVPRVAERDGAVAGGAALAGNARPFTEVYPEQVRHVFEVQGGLSAREEQQLSAIRRLMSAVENGSVADDRQIGPLPGVWWKTLSDYDQVAAANRVDVPLFFAHGGRDFQIPADPALSGWREGLDDPDTHRFERYPDLSHLFQPGTGPSLSTEYVFADNVARELVADLADWVTAL